MKWILLTQDKWATVDDEDFLDLTKHVWQYMGHKKNNYASRIFFVKGKRFYQLMHREILNLLPGDKRQVDHIDGNGLNNQKENLRITTQSQNMMNSSLGKNNKTGYKGLYWRKDVKMWQATITSNKKRIFLGSFYYKREAIKARKEAEIKYFGEYARLNP